MGTPKQESIWFTWEMKGYCVAREQSGGRVPGEGTDYMERVTQNAGDLVTILGFKRE